VFSAVILTNAGNGTYRWKRSSGDDNKRQAAGDQDHSKVTEREGQRGWGYRTRTPANPTGSAHFRTRSPAWQQQRARNCRTVSCSKLGSRTPAGGPGTVTQGCTRRHAGAERSPREAKQLVHPEATGARCPARHSGPTDGHFCTETRSTAARKEGKIVFSQTDPKGLWSKSKNNTQVPLCATPTAKPLRDTCCWRAAAFVRARVPAHLPASLRLPRSEVWVRPPPPAHRFSQASERLLCLDAISDPNNPNTPFTTPDSTAANSTAAFPAGLLLHARRDECQKKTTLWRQLTQISLSRPFRERREKPKASNSVGSCTSKGSHLAERDTVAWGRTPNSCPTVL